MSSTTENWRINNTEVNGSDDIQYFYCVTIQQTLEILTVIIALVGLAGNATVLWLLGFPMHRNAFSVYILNLAGADFLFLCIQTLYSLIMVISDFHKMFIIISKHLIVFLVFAYLAGLSMLTAISTECCLSVMWPIWLRCQCPRHTSAVVCALLWTLSLLLGFFSWKTCFPYNHSSWCMKQSFIIFAWLIVLFVSHSGSSLALLVRIFCSSQRMPVTRLYVTIALTVLVFLLFGLPFGICRFFLFWFPAFIEPFFCWGYDMTIFISSVNSSAHPIIYFLVGSIRHRRFQCRTPKLLLQRAMQDTREEEVGEERDSSGNCGEQEAVLCRDESCIVQTEV